VVPAHPLTARFVVAAVLLGALGGACGGDETDPAAFCNRYEELRADDPFGELDVASGAEMRTAFERLQDGASRLATTAPADAAVQAERYAATVDDLVAQQRAAGYDLRNLDLGAYRRATGAYNEAAASLENAARAACR
jgi:hypothetical protein